MFQPCLHGFHLLQCLLLDAIKDLLLIKNCKRLISIKKPQITFSKIKTSTRTIKSTVHLFESHQLTFSCKKWGYDEVGLYFFMFILKIGENQDPGVFWTEWQLECRPSDGWSTTALSPLLLTTQECCNSKQGETSSSFEIQRWKFDVKISMGMILSKGCFGQNLPRMLQLKILKGGNQFNSGNLMHKLGWLDLPWMD